MTKAEGGLDIEYPVFLTGDPAAGIGDGDDVVELLADVGGYDEIATLRSQ